MCAYMYDYYAYMRYMMLCCIIPYMALYDII